MPTAVALIKNVPDTWAERRLEEDHTLDRGHADSVLDEVNEYSVEQALRVKEADPEAGWRVVALTVGPKEADESLRKAIAMGSDDAVAVTDERLAGSDVLGTAWALASAIGKLDDPQLVVAGSYSSDGAMGAIAGLVAEYLQRPALTNLVELNVVGGDVTGVRVDERGRFDLKATLPAVVSITDKAEQPRFPKFKGLMAAKKHDITRFSLEDIGVTPEQVGLATAATAVTAATTRPPRQAGETIYGEDAPERLADFLAERNLL